MSTLPALNLLLVPLLIGAVTLASRRWGPSVGGWISAFPVISAPILFSIAIEHGSTFAANAAAGTLAAVLANLAFSLGYAWTATRFSWPSCLAAGFAGYFLTVACLSLWAPSLYVAVPVVLIVLLLAPRLYPLPVPTTPSLAEPGNDIFWRMGTGVLLVFLVTHFASGLGPRLSGSFAMFPVLAPVLAVFSHRESGPAFAIHLLRGMVLGYYSFAVFCIVLSQTLIATSVGFSFLISLGCALLVQIISRISLQRVQTSAAK